MRDFLRRPKIFATVAMLAAAVGACAPSSLTEIGNINLLPKVSNLSKPDWMTYSGSKNEFVLRPVSANDLVSAEGQCAAEVASAPAAESSETTPALPPVQSGGIALQMTECDVVRRAGSPEQLQVGTDERGDRAAVITYIQGPRPGIYRFSAGRLTSIERAPEAPGARAAPKAKAKKAARS